jgi:photosystem II stability/assembly factor-like uncharacterized protein
LLQFDRVQKIFIAGSGKIFIATLDRGVKISDDRGETWGDRLDYFTNGSYIENILSDSNGRIYVLETYEGISYSDDDGISWAKLDTPFLDSYFLSSYIELECDKNDNLYLSHSSRGIYISVDNGISWEKEEEFLEDYYVDGIETDKDGNVFCYSARKGLFKLRNSEDSWVDVNRGMKAQNVAQLTGNDSGQLFALSNNQVYSSYNSTLEWENIHDGIGDSMYIDYFANHIYGIHTFKEDHIIASNQYYSYLSTNGGTTWENINNRLNKDISYIHFNSTSEDSIYAINETGLYLSNDYGSSWQLLTASVEDGRALIADKQGNIYIFGNELYLFHQDSLSWEKINLMNSNFGIGFDRFGNIYNGSWGVLYKTSDKGITWEELSDGLSSNDYITFVEVNSKDEIYVATSDSGIYKSVDYGETWSPFNDDLNNKGISDLYIDNEDNIYAGTQGSGIYMLASPTSINPIELNRPENFYLSQNYPNPFNPNTVIEYQVPNEGFVEISVYNALGQKVTTPVSKMQRQGSYRINFSGDKLSSGIYYYRLVVNNVVETRKMMLVK